MKTFVIKQDEEIVAITDDFLTKKEAVLDHAQKNGINPFLLKATEVEREDIRESYVEKTVSDYFQEHYEEFTISDVKGASRKVLDEKRVWKMLDTLMHSYAVTYMADGKKKPDREKGVFVDEKI